MSIFFVIILAAIACVGDYFLKIANDEERLFSNRWFVLGFCLISSTIFGWAYLIKHMKLGNLGALFGASTALILFLIGVLFFNESFNRRELLGVIFAIAAICLIGNGGSK